MKHSCFKIVCLIVWACITVISGFGDDTAINYETFILEPFNGDSEYTWQLEGSRFTAKANERNTVDYPISQYVSAYPMAAFGTKKEDTENLKSFGINGRFNRQGYNWIDIYPTKEAQEGDGAAPFEIPIPGRLRSIDMWVWGSNLKFYIDVYLRDYQGVVHSLKLGDISYTGWKNLRVNIPGNIMQSKRILPAYAGLKFVKFRIWTTPSESVGNFYVYFKQFKVLTDKFESLFDGNDLADPEYIEQIWKN
jgi:hypothetical protein